MYKLIATDCDGTLLNDNKKISQNTVNTIKKAIDKGKKVVLSSARPFYRLETYLKELDLIIDEQYTICFNGAVIVKNIDKQIIHSSNFEEDEVVELIQIAKKFETEISLYTMNNLISEKVSEFFKNNENFNNVNFRITKFNNIDFNKEIIYKIVFVNNPKNIIEIKNKLPKSIFDKYEITSSIPEYIEFVKKGITKSKALENICKKCNIDKSEVIAVGDADNDLKMIEFAGLGVAVENATKLLKEKANYITTSNNNDGVEKVISKFMLND